MKKCPACGREYPDAVSECATDSSSLISCDSPHTEAPDFHESKDGADALPVPGWLPLLLLRCVGALAASFVVSFVVFYLLALLANVIFSFLPFADRSSFILFGGIFVAVGFCGVFAGAIVLPQRLRRKGAAVLVILGLAFYVYLAGAVLGVFAVDRMMGLGVLLALAVGGTIATILFWLQPPAQNLPLRGRRPTAAWPSEY